MEVKLVMFKPNGQKKEFKIRRETSIIGRGDECTLRVPLLNVSRQHCELILGEDELRVRDLASSNGTYVNNRRINETALKAGDRLVIGPVVFTVQIDGQPPEITPIKTKAQKAAEAEMGVKQPAAAREPGLHPDEGEVVELEPDNVVDVSEAGAEESDPIAALEALAEQSKKKEKEG